MITNRHALVVTLNVLLENRTTKKAIEVHSRLRLLPPTVEDITRYNKIGRIDDSTAAQKFVESMLDLRTKPLPKGGPMRENRRQFQEDVLTCLIDSVEPKDEENKKKYEKLALSFSRLFAYYYRDENDCQPAKLEGRLERLLPFLAQHLLAEVELCIEAKFTSPNENLSKVSVFDIQAKLDMLTAHADEVVRDNAKTIVRAALNRGNLELADTLAKGAKAKLDMLTAHADAVVRNNAKTIVCTALVRGNLGLADTLAEGAKKKLDMLERDPTTKPRARRILSGLISSGSLEGQVE